MDPTTERTLQEVLLRESSTLLQYVGEVYPWVAPEDAALLKRFQSVVGEDRKALASLGRFLQRQRIAPRTLGPIYPTSFTGLGFIGLRAVLPTLVERQRQSIARLEQDHATAGDADARTELWKLLELKKQHLTALEEMTASRPPAVPA